MKVCVLTGARSDYGCLQPVLRALDAEPRVEPELLVTGAHLVEAFGLTVWEVEADGYPIAARVPCLDEADDALGQARAIGRAVQGLGEALAQRRPDLLLVLGDRPETFAAAAAALPLRIPVAHLHGGELSLGAIDDALRHALTKLSHLHFVAAEDHARRVRQLGEEPWRVVVSGAPALDRLRELTPLSREELGRRVGLPLDEPPLLVTFHPVSTELEHTEAHLRALLKAVARTAGLWVFTLPGADAAGRQIAELLRAFVEAHPGRATLVESLGGEAYFSLLGQAWAMLGNSSSGLIEAPSFALPVVNVGSRQEGRLRGANVIDVAPSAAAIGAGLRSARDPAFRAALQGQPNPYGDGQAAPRIVQALLELGADPRLLRKRFVDLPGGAE